LIAQQQAINGLGDTALMQFKVQVWTSDIASRTTMSDDIASIDRSAIGNAEIVEMGIPGFILAIFGTMNLHQIAIAAGIRRRNQRDRSTMGRTNVTSEIAAFCGEGPVRRDRVRVDDIKVNGIVCPRRGVTVISRRLPPIAIIPGGAQGERW